jgi:putative ABC transport system permease protein
MLRDLAAAGAVTVLRRWQRFMLSLVGVAVGVGTLSATVGLTQSNANNIAATLASYSANTLTVRLPSDQWARPEADIVGRALQIPGVTGVGTFTEFDERDGDVSVRSVRGGGRAVPIVVASMQGLQARGVDVRSGTLASSLAASLDHRLVAVGSAVARDLHVSPEDGTNVVLLNGNPYSVMAIVDETGERSLLSTAVVVPPAAAAELGLDGASREVTVSFGRGDRAFVTQYIATAINPERPFDASVESRPDPATLTGRITADTAGLILVLSIVTTVAGAIGVANTMLIAVWERRSEIGVRRALGASRLQVGVLFLFESVIVGVAGGVVGWVLGVLVAASVAQFRDWAFTLPPWAAGLPLVGLVVGVVAGVHPAWRAANVDPADLLRE